jgi:hypothetical protein
MTHDSAADRHANRREQIRRKRRHGMRISGRSVRTLARLQAVRAPQPAAHPRRLKTR